MRRSLFQPMTFGLLVLLSIAVTPTLAQQQTGETIHAGRYDNGKMWTFDFPPTEQLREAYDFEPDAAWFEHARLGALRLPNCTASFVSPYGLVLTNHHCGREPAGQVAKPGENLLDNGFMAASLGEERAVEGLYVDQLIAIEDVTDEIYSALENEESDAEKAVARREAIAAATKRITEAAGGADAGVMVQIISLFNGGRYSAYTFRRFTDVRLVMTPELSLGYFGGDSDNFTYPRYALDMTFFRVYEDGKPYESKYFFKWSQNGSHEGEPVFVVGNPGSTNRLETVAQLEWRRDVQEKDILALLDTRIAALETYLADHPSDALRNQLFGLKNSQKLYRGRVKGLNDPIIMAKRADTERQFVDDLAARYSEDISEDVNLPYLTLIDDIDRIQEEKRMFAPDYGAFLAFRAGSSLASETMQRAVLAHTFLTRRNDGVADSLLRPIRERLLSLTSQDPQLDRLMYVARLNDFIQYFGSDDPDVQQVLAGRSPEEVATFVMENSELVSSPVATASLDDGTLTLDDPAIQVVEPFMPRLQIFRSAFAGLSTRESELNAQHGRAGYEIYGTSRPPDATFSLRIADGVVSSYDYNGTHAPAFTTFYGLFNRYYAHKLDASGTGEWTLPDRWISAPSTFDRSTPVDLVSTNDIIGGNSGSPLLNKDLEIVGLVFDGNIESLPSAFIYQTEVARTVSVDSRGIMEALDDIYDMDRIVAELKTGQLFETEVEADAVNE